MSYFYRPNIDELEGKTATAVSETGDELRFQFSDGTAYTFYHDQDCCESVRIEEIHGDLEDLVGTPLLVAEEVSSDAALPPDGYCDSYTWTFYRFGTIRGTVTVRWLGQSNGYYSESVDLRRDS